MADPMTPRETRRALDADRQVALIDVREPLDYSDGHVAESTPVPRRLLEFRLPAVVPDGDVTVILCDRRGERAPRDAAWLESLGATDVRYLDGGVAAWADAGLDTVEARNAVYQTAFNFPSKEFGERVQVEADIEQIGPDRLKELLDDAEDVLVADVRTPAEHRDATIPGAVNVQGVDLAPAVDRLRDGDQPVVVHCTGRTRSIIGTASLERLGFENVYELENGTMGWALAGYDLERGAGREAPTADGFEDRERLRTAAESLLATRDVSLLAVDEFRTLLDDEDAVVYPVDVRTRAEYEAGHVPSTLSIPGGQAIQTADDHFAVRNGRIVFVSSGHVRAAITAYWFAEMGYPNVAVLEGGVGAWRDAGRPLDTGRDRRPPLRESVVRDAVEVLSPSALADAMAGGEPTVVNVDTSEQFEQGHVPGASWVSRYDLEGWLDGADIGSPLVLTCRHGRFSTYAAAAIQGPEGPVSGDVRVLDGGTGAWAASGRSLATGTDGMEFDPRDDVPHPTDQGDWAMRAYLDWEEGLGDEYA